MAAGSISPGCAPYLERMNLMANHAVAPANVLVPKTGIRRFWLNFKRNWQLHLMMLILNP